MGSDPQFSAIRFFFRGARFLLRGLRSWGLARGCLLRGPDGGLRVWTGFQGLHLILFLPCSGSCSGSSTPAGGTLTPRPGHCSSILPHHKASARSSSERQVSCRVGRGHGEPAAHPVQGVLLRGPPAFNFFRPFVVLHWLPSLGAGPRGLKWGQEQAPPKGRGWEVPVRGTSRIGPEERVHRRGLCRLPRLSGSSLNTLLQLSPGTGPTSLPAASPFPPQPRPLRSTFPPSEARPAPSPLPARAGLRLRG